jgi:hypothetical protein
VKNENQGRIQIPIKNLDFVVGILELKTSKGDYMKKSFSYKINVSSISH